MVLNTKTKVENQFSRINKEFREPIKKLTFEWALDRQKSFLNSDEFNGMDEHNKFWKSSGSKSNMFIHSRYENTKIINGEIKSNLKEYYLMPECVEECLKEVLKIFRDCGIPPEGKGKYITS